MAEAVPSSSPLPSVAYRARHNLISTAKVLLFPGEKFTPGPSIGHRGGKTPEEIFGKGISHPGGGVGTFFSKSLCPSARNPSLMRRWDPTRPGGRSVGGWTTRSELLDRLSRPADPADSPRLVRAPLQISPSLSHQTTRNPRRSACVDSIGPPTTSSSRSRIHARSSPAVNTSALSSFRWGMGSSAFARVRS